MGTRTSLLPGTLDFLIPTALSAGARHAPGVPGPVACARAQALGA